MDVNLSLMGQHQVTVQLQWLNVNMYLLPACKHQQLVSARTAVETCVLLPCYLWNEVAGVQQRQMTSNGGDGGGAVPLLVFQFKALEVKLPLKVLTEVKAQNTPKYVSKVSLRFVFIRACGVLTLKVQLNERGLRFHTNRVTSMTIVIK